MCISIKGYAQQKISLQVGDTIPNIEFYGLLGKKVNLNTLRGSYVLITFWASWNNESRIYNRELLPVYSRYKDKKFELGKRFNIVSVSIDNNKDYYQLALKKDNPAWYYQFCDFEGWKSNIISTCKIYRIPTNILVDPNGVINKINISIKELELLLKTY